MAKIMNRFGRLKEACLFSLNYFVVAVSVEGNAKPSEIDMIEVKGTAWKALFDTKHMMTV